MLRPPDGRGPGFRMSSTGGAPRPIRTIPDRSSRSSRPVESGRAEAGSRRATTTPAIGDEHGIAGANLVHEGAQPVLQLADRRGLHVAILATANTLV